MVDEAVSGLSWASFGAPSAPDVDPTAMPWVPAGLEVTGLVGRGGMGVVWRAYDREHDRDVALKTVRAPTPEAVARLKREFRVARGVVHPNLVALYELHAKGLDVLFTMELVLGDRLSRTRPDDPALRDRLAQLSSGLQALHDAGLIHGDVKPDNVLVQADGRVVLLDLGLARAVGALLDGPIGTPGYVAPEVAPGLRCSAALDAYGLGALVYRVLAGREPTHGDAETRRWMAEGRWFPPPDEVDVRAPRDLSALAMSLLDPDPATRATLATARSALSAPDAPTSVWIERPEAVRTVQTAWRRARATGCTLVVSGPGGVGKTSLVRRELTRLGREIAWGQATPVEHVPYQALDSALDALWRAHDAAGAPVESRARAGLLFRPRDLAGGDRPLTAGEVTLAITALGDVVAEVGARGGVCVVVDDLHVADADSLGVLSRLLRADRPGCLWVLLTRPEGWATVERLLGDAVAVERLELAPFTGAEVAAVVDGIDVDGEVLPASLGLVAMAGRAGSWSDRLAATVAELSDDEVDALRLACLTARPLSPASLERLGVAVSSVRRLVARGLLVIRTDPRGGATVVPVHDLVRDAVVDGLDDGRDLHRRLAALFADQGAALAGPCAHHHLACGDERAGREALVRAGRFALDQAAFDWAARLFERAAALGADGASVAEAHGFALASAQRHDEAIALWLDAAERADGLARIQLLGHAIDLLFGAGRFDRGLGALRAVVAEVGEALPTGRRGFVAFIVHTLRAAWRSRRPLATAPSASTSLKLTALWTAANSLTPFDPVAGQAVHARHRTLAFSVDAPVHRANALGAQLLFRRGQGWSVDREEKLLRDLLLWVPDGVKGFVYGCRGYGLRLGCDFARSVEVLQQALVYFGDQQHRYWYSRFGRVALLMNDAYHAPVPELVARRDETLADARARGDLTARVGLDLSLTWLIHLLRDDDADAATACLDALPAIWGRELQPEQQLRLSLARVQVALYAGELDAARAMLDRPNAAVKRHWRFHLIPFTWHLCRGRLGLLLGDRSRVEAAARDLDRMGEPVTRGAADLLRVGIGGGEGLRERAGRRLSEQRHRLFAMALESSDERLVAHGVANPVRVRRWLAGRGGHPIG